MIRRSPTRIALRLEDLQEWEKEQRKRDEKLAEISNVESMVTPDTTSPTTPAINTNTDTTVNTPASLSTPTSTAISRATALDLAQARNIRIGYKTRTRDSAT